MALLPARHKRRRCQLSSTFTQALTNVRPAIPETAAVAFAKWHAPCLLFLLDAGYNSYATKAEDGLDVR